MHGHLTECAQEEVNHGAAEEVDQEDRGAGGLDGAGGAVEQAGADGRAQGDEVQVTVFQAGALGGGFCHGDASSSEPLLWR